MGSLRIANVFCCHVRVSVQIISGTRADSSSQRARQHLTREPGHFQAPPRRAQQLSRESRHTIARTYPLCGGEFSHSFPLCKRDCFPFPPSLRDVSRHARLPRRRAEAAAAVSPRRGPAQSLPVSASRRPLTAQRSAPRWRTGHTSDPPPNRAAAHPSYGACFRSSGPSSWRNDFCTCVSTLTPASHAGKQERERERRRGRESGICRVT